MLRNNPRSVSSFRRASEFFEVPVPKYLQEKPAKKKLPPVVLYVLHIGGKWNEGYYDSVHTLPSAFRFSLNREEDTVDQLTLPPKVASKLLADDGTHFPDGYARYDYCSAYITKKDVF
jgi:hypothetical protein